MLQVTDLTNDPRQSLEQTLEDNTTFTLNLNYSENTNCWFFDLAYPAKNFFLNGVRLVLSTNLLKQWQRILPFGLVCFSPAPAPLQQDPFLLNDFITTENGSSRIKLYVLTKAETEALQDAIDDQV